MKVYHGSSVVVRSPDIFHSRAKVDFGKGFYVTPLKEQAYNWCLRFKKSGNEGVISRYDFNEAAYKELNVLIFTEYSSEWLDFVINCRQGDDKSTYDIIQGGIANDKVFNTLELFLDGLIDKAEAIKRLRYEKPNLQLCFRTQNSIDEYLNFEGSEKV